MNDSFEFSEWTIKSLLHNLRLVVICRPPSSPSSPSSPSGHMTTFFEEFSDYLQFVVLSKEQLLITGHLNIHVVAVDDPDAIKFTDLLESFCLQQHVTIPTHQRGRALDFIISRRSGSIIKSTLVAHCFISDHASITCSLLPAKPASKVKTLSYRETKSVDFKHLSADIADSDLYNMSEVNTTSCDQRPDELVRNYNSTLSHLLDRHAPLKTNTILVRP